MTRDEDIDVHATLGNSERLFVSPGDDLVYFERKSMIRTMFHQMEGISAGKYVPDVRGRDPT